jgi:phage repressor protein C with HTH and peptisase S24 domain/DNA-binding Xre family transcriptional regulator
MSRTELVERTGISKQQLSRLENGQIRLRLDHLKPFAAVLDYSPEQILLWGRLNELEDPSESGDHRGNASTKSSTGKRPSEVREIDTRAPLTRGRVVSRFRAENWLFPEGFVVEQLHTTSAQLLVLEMNGDSMAPTVLSGERVIVDTGHKNPIPDGLYAIRDAFEAAVVRRLQVLRSATPTRVKIISDNSNHASEEIPLSDLVIVGKVVCCLKIV